MKLYTVGPFCKIEHPNLYHSKSTNGHKYLQDMRRPPTHQDPWGADPHGRTTSSRSSLPWLRLCLWRGHWGRVRDVEPRPSTDGLVGKGKGGGGG